jgi:hypothetical protein
LFAYVLNQAEAVPSADPSLRFHHHQPLKVFLLFLLALIVEIN